MKRIIWVLLISFLFLNATGSSFAEIKLTPIATHENGEVLFQTYSNINGMGAHNNSYIKIGWLVVSSAGVWDEEVALFGYEGENQKKWKQVDTQISAYREGKINLKSPGSVLKKLMLKYNFTKETPLIYEKNKILELKPKQSCYLGKCVDRVLTQRTIEEYSCDNIVKRTRGYRLDDDNKIIQKPFVYKGVVLIPNRIHYEEDIVQYGGEFNIINTHHSRDIGFDSMDVDAIILLEDEYLSKNNLKTPSKPYYKFLGANEAISLGFYNKWVPMYQSKEPKYEEDNRVKEREKFLKELYLETDLIAILKVTDFYIYEAPSNESGYNIKFKADVVQVIKGSYLKKSIIFYGDFDNAPDAESFEQLYLLHYDEKEKEYSSDEFFQFNPTIHLLQFFRGLK